MSGFSSCWGKPSRKKQLVRMHSFCNEKHYDDNKASPSLAIWLGPSHGGIEGWMGSASKKIAASKSSFIM